MSQPLAEFTNYDELRRALNAVRDYRQMPLRVMNDLAGCAEGYFEKILGPRPGRHVGVKSLSDAFGVLGIKCVLIEDPEAWARIEKHSRRQIRDDPHFRSVQGGVLHVQIKRNFLRKIGAKGGIARWIGVNPKKRSKHAKAAAKARHSRLSEEQRKLVTRAATKARWANKKQIGACGANGVGSSQGYAFQQPMAASSVGLWESLRHLPISAEGREGSHRADLSGRQRLNREPSASLPEVQFIEGAIVDRSSARELEGSYGKDRAQGNPCHVDSKEEEMKSKRKTKEQARRARQRRATHKARKAGGG